MQEAGRERQRSELNLLLRSRVAQSRSFSVIELEDGIEAGHLEGLADDLVRAHQFESSALWADYGMAADHAADSGGVDNRNTGEVDDDVVRAVSDRIAPSVPELIDRRSYG